MDLMVDGDRVVQIEKLLRDRDIRFEVTSAKQTRQRNISPIPTSRKRSRSPPTINICNEGLGGMDVMVKGDRVGHISKLLGEREISFEDTGTVFNGQPTRGPIPILPRSRHTPSKRYVDWNDYYPLKALYEYMDSLEEKYPSTCTVSTIGRTVEGRDIKMLRISNSDAMNKGVWLDAGIHAREWISISVATYIADQFAKNFNVLPEYITNKDWCFVPVVNPDGYHYSYTIDRMWRKNRAVYKGTPCGVDLNRNFGCGWKRYSNDPSDDPSHINYRGTGAFSEPETKAIKDVILCSNTDFKIFLTLHSYSEVISFPWCHTSDPCTDYVTLLEGATAMAKAIYDVNRRMYKVGNFKDIMYRAGGTSVDWSYGVAQIPYSYLIELRSKEHKFLLPREEILDCCKEIFSGVKALAKFVDGC